MDTEIAYQNTDITLRAMAEQFKNKNLKIFGLKTAKIKGLMPTVMPVLEAKERRSDVVFLLEDDTLLHLEFQTTKKKGDLKRFMYYDARITSRQERKINTAVIYSGSISAAPTKLNNGSIKYHVQNVFMDRFDGDLEYARLRAKIHFKRKLHETDYLKLIFLPLMKSKYSEEKQALKAAKLACNEQVPEKPKNLIVAALVVLTDKFMSQTNKQKLLEVLKLTQIEQWIKEEGRQEGRQEGKQEGRQERNKEIALAALKEGSSVDFIMKITGLDKKTIMNLNKKRLN